METAVKNQMEILELKKIMREKFTDGQSRIKEIAKLRVSKPEADQYKFDTWKKLLIKK